MDNRQHAEWLTPGADHCHVAYAEVDALYDADVGRFEKSLLTAFDARTADLLRLALHVYAIDRLIRRVRRSPWSYRPREITLPVPVNDIEFWRKPSVNDLVVDVLEFLSDDLWEIRFCRADAHHKITQPCFPLNEQIDDVFLFSGGLDSVAGAAAHLADTSRRQLAVTVLHNSLPKEATRKLLRRIQPHVGKPVPWGQLSNSLVGPGRFDQQETSQRCRAFLFVASGLAAAAAKAAGRVLMFESGTGAVNAPLMAGMATGGRNTKSSHPHFLGMMSELGSLMCQRRVSVELPYWRLTKGELVKILADLGLADVALDSQSCAHLPRRSGHRQCGVCAACITRRQALAFAGIREPADVYEYDIFSNDPSRIPPEDKLDDLKAVLNQVLAFEAIGAPHTLTPTLCHWLLGTRIISREDEAQPWLELLWRYRSEWLQLARSHRDAALPWAHRLIPQNTNRYANASGF
jgi:7-cyano-7-deazaguanine synthase in queuosine biosynthesis